MTTRALALSALLPLAACGGTALGATPPAAPSSHPSSAARPSRSTQPLAYTVPIPTTPATGELLSTGRRVARDQVGGACSMEFRRGNPPWAADVVGGIPYAHQQVFAGVSWSSHYRYLEVYVVASRMAEGRRLLRAKVPSDRRARVMIVAVPQSLATMEAQMSHLPFKDAWLGLTGAGPWAQAGGLVMMVRPELMSRARGRWVPTDPARARRLVELGGVCFEPMGEAHAA